jgi:hypothetical protein
MEREKGESGSEISMNSRLSSSNMYNTVIDKAEERTR